MSYTYDAAGRRTSLTLPNGVLVEYSYDAASRLTEITYKQNGTTLLGNLTYEYDKNGNRTKIGGTFARTGLPQSIASTAYNAANHQTTFGDKTLTYDNNGNLSDHHRFGRHDDLHLEREESVDRYQRAGSERELCV